MTRRVLRAWRHAVMADSRSLSSASGVGAERAEGRDQVTVWRNAIALSRLSSSGLHRFSITPLFLLVSLHFSVWERINASNVVLYAKKSGCFPSWPAAHVCSGFRVVRQSLLIHLFGPRACLKVLFEVKSTAWTHTRCVDAEVEGAFDFPTLASDLSLE